jgi:hypothetical protein
MCHLLSPFTQLRNLLGKRIGRRPTTLSHALLNKTNLSLDFARVAWRLRLPGGYLSRRLFWRLHYHIKL